MLTSTLNVSSMSNVKAKVEIYEGSTLVTTCTCSDALSDFKIYREGDLSKFFGFGVCQKLAINLIDLEREIALSTKNTVKVCLGDGTTFDCPYPVFNITEVERDEDSNTISLTGFDNIHKASEHSVSELNLTAPYTLRDVAEACATLLGLTLKIDLNLNYVFALEFEDGANIAPDSDLNVRDVMTALAEVTQTIYYINNNNELVFKRLDKSGKPVLTAAKKDYYALTTQTERKLVAIASVTELGDNVTATTGEEGVTQYVRENPFWELRTDLGIILQEAITDMGGLTICQFDADWDGNYLLEIGDKIALTTEDDNIVESFILSDTVTYDGTYYELTEWKFTETESETASNPANIGEKISQTVARVDKVNKEIVLLVRDVKTIEDEDIPEIEEAIKKLEQEVKLKIDADSFDIAIEEALSDGVSKVTTTTGYSFDKNGLTISKSDSELSTNINEDGLSVFRDNKEVLTADNTGVKAEDLHATTYLKIGAHVTFSDMDNERIGCYWTD